MDIYLHQPDIFNGLDRSQCYDKVLWSVGVRYALSTHTNLPRGCPIGGYFVGSFMVDTSEKYESHLATMLSDVVDIIDPLGRVDFIRISASHF
jgi:hypothetical protein